MSLTLVDRLRPRLRLRQQSAIDAGELRKRDELELLEPRQLRPLAALSLALFVVSAVFFCGFNLAVYVARTHHTGVSITAWGVLLGVTLNIAAYIVVLPLHEAMHALAFVLWGGRPYFGAKLPLALYCGARDQLFRRNQYLVVGLAPLVLITLAAIIFTLLAPGLAAYTLFGTIGNISGAAGDLWSVGRLLRQPSSVLVEDTASGYRSWELPTRLQVEE
jgi:hypothetical protein